MFWVSLQEWCESMEQSHFEMNVYHTCIIFADMLSTWYLQGNSQDILIKMESLSYMKLFHC